MPNLIVLTGVRRGTVLSIDSGALIGRCDDADLNLPDDKKVSSTHARILVQEDAFTLRDLASTNGTFLNGNRVETEMGLRVGDILHIGTTELLFTDRASLDRPEVASRNPVGVLVGDDSKIIAPEASFDVRLVADTDEELILEPSQRSAGLTLMLPVVHKVERTFSQALNLPELIETVALHFSQAVGGKGVMVELQHDGQPRVELQAWVRNSTLFPISDGGPDFEVRGRLLQRALRGGGALLGRSEHGEMAVCIGLPHAAGVAGAVYVHDVRDGITKEDLRPLLLLANLAGVHCRTHLLVSQQRQQNEELEAARARLARWNEELQTAVESRTAELVRSEASYRSLFHESRDGNFTTDRRGRIQAINRKAAEILELDLATAVGQPLWLMFSHSVVSRMLALEPSLGGETRKFETNLDHLATVDSPDVMVVPLKTTSGRERIAEVLVRPIFTGPVAEGIHVVLRDVTERHEAEERSRLLSRIVENVREAVVSTTLDGEVRTWNPGAEALYQYRAEEVVGQLLPTVPDDRGAELESILAAVAEGHSLAVRTERLSRDERVIPVLATFAPVSDAGGGIVGVVELARDLSDQLELEDRMRWRERLASFGELAAGLAHELGNPLANLRSGVEYLLDRPRDPEVTESLELLHHEIERLHRLVKQTLDLARWKPPVIGRIDAQELLDYVAAVVKDRAAELGIELSRVQATEDVTVLGDPDQLKQALLNLISNAFGSMQPGGQLELALVGVSAAGEESEAGFCVRDTGCGIPPDELERIFDLFFSGRPDGSGIGLAVVKRIVDLHQGRIVIESAPELGTTVQILLPAAAFDEEEA